MKSQLAALAAAIVVAACASVPMADPQQDAALKSFRVAPDRGGIYVYRNESMGAMIKMDVTIDGMALGQTAAKTYLYQEVAPGRRTITSKAENTDTLEVDVKPGTVVFVWQEVKMGVLMARSKLQLVDEATGRAGVNETKLGLVSATAMPAAAAPTAPAAAAAGTATVSAATASAASAATTSAIAPTASGLKLRRGDALEYVVTDRYTNTTRRARWTVDRVEADRLSFNQGERIESLDGALLQAGSGSTGDFEQLEPPGGWVPAGVTAGRRWSAAYNARDGGQPSRMDLEARAVAPMPITTPAGRFDTLLVEYTGWAERSFGATSARHSVELKLWVEPATRRVIAFESEIRGGRGGVSRQSRERVELAQVLKAD